MKAAAYLVLQKHGRKLTVARVTQRAGALSASEARVKIEIDVPDDLFESPVVTVQVTDKKKVAVAIADQED